MPKFHHDMSQLQKQRDTIRKRLGIPLSPTPSSPASLPIIHQPIGTPDSVRLTTPTPPVTPQKPSTSHSEGLRTVQVPQDLWTSFTVNERFAILQNRLATLENQLYETLNNHQSPTMPDPPASTAATAGPSTSVNTPAITTSPGVNFSFRPLESFKGEDTEDPSTWLNRYKNFATFQKWTDEQKANAFGLFMHNSAELWYNLPEDTKSNWVNIEAAFKERFVSGLPKWVNEQALSNRKQGPNESVSAYIYDMKIRCARLGKTPAEALNYFVMGLLPGIRSYVIGQDPKTITQAETCARLGESINQMSSLNTDTTTTVTAITNAVMTPLVDKLSSEIAALQTEVKKQNTASAAPIRGENRFWRPPPRQQGPRPQGASSNFYSRPAPQYFTPPQRPLQQRPQGNQQWPRNQYNYQQQQNVSTITCYSCGRPNHTSRNCYRRQNTDPNFTPFYRNGPQKKNYSN